MEKVKKVLGIPEGMDWEVKDRLYYLDVPRSNCKFYGSHNLEYEKYYRSNHRYLLGKECIIHSVLFSEFNVLLYRSSNIISFSSLLKKKKQKKFEVLTEINSSNLFFARWKWYLKFFLPAIFGNLNYKIVKHD